MTVRRASENDIKHWSEMRCSLWPDSCDLHTLEIQDYFSNTSNDIHECFLVDEYGAPVGFIELNIRNYAEGSNLAKVPYVEGWFVEEKFRGKGLGKQLMTQAEIWAKSLGYDELASDTEIENVTSINAHKKIGFEEIDRIVCFLKTLK